MAPHVSRGAVACLRPAGKRQGRATVGRAALLGSHLPDSQAICCRLPAEVREASGAGGDAAGMGSAAAAAGSAAGAGGASAARRRRLHEHSRPACCSRAPWGCAGPSDGLPCRARQGVRAAAAAAARMWRRARARLRGPAGGAAAGARGGAPAGGPQRRLQAEAEEEDEEDADVDKSSAQASNDVVPSDLMAAARAGGAAGPPGAGGAGGALVDRQRLFSVRGTA